VAEFRTRQLQILRKLLLRRLYALTLRSASGVWNEHNLRVAVHVFGLPVMLHELISRPTRAAGAPAVSARRAAAAAAAAAAAIAAGAAVGDNAALLEYVVPGEDVEVAALDGAGGELEGYDDNASYTDWEGAPLPEEALGWWPAGGRPAPTDRPLSLAGGGGSGSGGGSSPMHSGGGRLSPHSAAGFAADAAMAAKDAAVDRTLGAALLGALTADLIARKRFRTKMCHSWLRTGTCPRGSGCDYAHGAHELRQSHEARDNRFRTRLCRTWMSTCGAFCPHRTQCAFAHGVHELRIRLPDADEEASLLAAAEARPRSGTAAPPPGAPGSATAAALYALPTGGTIVAPLGVPAPTPGGMAPSAVAAVTLAGAMRKFKAHLCRAWLQGAAEGAMIASVRLVLDRTEDVSSLRFDAARSGSRRCARGDACPHAHGLAELRLPAVVEQVRLVEALACETPRTRLGGVGDGEDGAVPLRDLTLMLIASGLLTTHLPAPLIPRVAAVAAAAGAHPRLPDGGIMHGFEGLPYAFAAALSAALLNPMLQVVLPHTAADRASSEGGMRGGPGGGGGGGGGRREDAPPGHRTGLAKIFSAVGNETADAALLTAAVSLGGATVALPLNLLPPGDGAASEEDLRAATSGTGRYGILLRRRLELRAALHQVMRARTARGATGLYTGGLVGDGGSSGGGGGGGGGSLGSPSSSPGSGRSPFFAAMTSTGPSPIGGMGSGLSPSAVAAGLLPGGAADVAYAPVHDAAGVLMAGGVPSGGGGGAVGHGPHGWPAAGGW